MKELCKLLLFISVVPMFVYAQGQKKGTVSVLLFSNGKPLLSNEVKLDGKKIYKTDMDGALQVELSVGKHQIEIFGKDAKGINLGYFKKPIVIKEGRDTQVIATLTKQGADSIDIDTPVAMKKVKDVKTQESTGTGKLSGTILSSEGGHPIEGARVFVRGTSVDVRTDAKGHFSATVPSGTTLSISVVHSAYSAQTVSGIKVKKGAVTRRTIRLTPASMELEEFIVLAPKVEGSIADVMQEEKQMNAIANIVGAEEFSKKGDSDASSALKRVTGVTLVGNNIFVRGLGDRYSNVELNSLPLPSPNPIKRTVPLDIFPSGVIKSMKIQKSATADIPASFGGGYIDIRTKDKTKDNYIKISIGAKGNSYTGTEVNTYEGSTTDWQGVDDGYRSIPQEILDASQIVVGEPVVSFDTAHGFTQEQLETFMRDIVNRKLTTRKENLPWGGKVSVEGAYSVEIAEDHTLSFFANYTYNQEHRYREEDYFTYAYDRQNDKLFTTPEQFGKTFRTIEQYTNSGIFNVGYNYADVFHIKYTKLYTRNSESVTQVSDGIANSDDDWKIRYDLNWEERVLDVDQVSGDFAYALFDFENKFRFGFESAKASLNQPGNYKYAYLRNLRFDGTLLGEPFLHSFTTNAFLNLTSDDDLDAFYLKNKTMVNLFTEKDYVDVGFSHSLKTRVSRYNKYQIDQSREDTTLTQDIDTIYGDNVRATTTDLFAVNISFQPAYWYDAEVEENSFYLNSLLHPMEGLEVILGVKKVDFTQTIFEYTNNFSALDPIEIVPNSLVFDDLLFSGSVKYKLNDNNHIDFALSNTYIVPDLREFSDAEFFHPYEVATVQGNPDLVNTFITSYDLKYSHYFSNTENIKVGLFYKFLDKPIEDVQLLSSSLPRYGFANADTATIYGIEIDGRKNLSFIYNKLSNYYLSGNFTYADSEVVLQKDQEGLYTTNNRQLQGLSQTVVNIALSYEGEGRTVFLSYNKMGERIRKLGLIDDQDEFPDFYEVPPALVDIVWIEQFQNGLSLKTKLGNLLDEETIWYQGSTENVTNRFKNGRTFSFEVSYKY
ncbi:MAG: hypothetical protein COA92_06430 [Sulfurovum sp.]|nr:MAG: hypothetical protein COA92_06430 [Sulfurovum sp.]